MSSARPLTAARRVWLTFLGGAIGATLRTLAMLVPTALVESAQLTIVNLIGALCLGLLLGSVTAPRFDGVRAFFGTGLLGGFTSYSALIVAMHPENDSLLGVVFGVGTVVASTALALAGLKFGRNMAAKHQAGGEHG